MAVRTNSFKFLLVSLVLAVAACGGRGTTPPHDAGHSTDMGPRTDMSPGLDLGPGRDMGMMGTDLGTMTDLGVRTDAGMCIATCSTNTQCSSTCPAMTGRVQCCDTSTHHCYPVTAAMCPAGGTDAGTGTDSGSMY